MKKILLILLLILISVISFAQRQRTTAVFDSDTTTRPKTGFYGIGIRSNNIYFVPRTGNNIRIANYSLFTGLTTNYVTKWNGTALSNSQIFDNGTNVGIGTATLTERLNILGGINFQDGTPNLYNSGTTGRILITANNVGGTASGGGVTLRSISASTNPSGLELYAGGAERVRINSSGSVGIGTTSPIAKLHTAATINTDQLILGVNGVNQYRFRVTNDNTNSLVIGNDFGGAFNVKNIVLAQTGNVGIGTTSVTNFNLRVLKNITGNAISSGISSEGVIQADVTEARIINAEPTVGAGTALTNLYHYHTRQGTFTGTATAQSGFFANSNLTGATNNYGFRGLIPSGTGRWNLYMDGTANNYMAGSLGIGTTTPDNSALLHVSSTTKGVLITRGTTAEINAIVSPANGLMAYNTTLNKLCVYENGTWKQVTTTNM